MLSFDYSEGGRNQKTCVDYHLDRVAG